MRYADRPWWEGGASKMSPLWKKGLVACYHPYHKRYDMGMGIEKCPTCLEIRVKSDEFWPPTIAPRNADLDGRRFLRSGGDEHLSLLAAEGRETDPHGNPDAESD